VDARASRIDAINGWWMVRGLYDIGDHPERREDIINALTKTQARLKREACTPRPHESDATKEVQDLIDRLQKKR
jgi:hypothetical protein